MSPKEPIVLHPAEPLALPAGPSTLPNPARIYHDTRARGSRPAIRAVLCRIAGWLLGKNEATSWNEACALQWWEIRARHVAHVRQQLAETSAPATVNRDLSILRGVITTAWENEMLTTDAYQHAIHVKGVDRDRSKAGRALGIPELHALVRAGEAWAKEGADGLALSSRALAILGFMYGAGLRRAEIVGILVENVEKGAARVALVGKRGKRRVAYIAPGWGRFIEAWIRFRGSEPGSLFKIRAPETVGRVITELRERAKVAAFTPHDLRRSFGTHMLASGKDLSLVRDLLGHSNVATTILYDRRGEKEMGEAVQDLPPPE